MLSARFSPMTARPMTPICCPIWLLSEMWRTSRTYGADSCGLRRFVEPPDELAGHQHPDPIGRVQQWERERHSARLLLWHVVHDDEPRSFLERARAGKQRC